MSTLRVDSIRGQTADGTNRYVVQTIYAETDTRQSATATSYTDLTGMTATITPISANNKILVQVCLNMGMQNAAMNLSCQLLRGSTNIFAGTDTSMKQGFVQTECGISGYQYEIKNFTATTLDSPATTSAITYKIQAKVNTAAGTWYMNRNHHNATDQGTTKSSITLLEIAQ